MKLNFETNIAEGTPEELVEYLRLVEEGEKKSGNELFSFAHSHQPDEDTLKSLVGPLVKVADSYTDSIKLSVDEAVEEAIEEEEEPSTELKVGDKVKVLKSVGGAEGEATVTKILEGGNVLIAGTSKVGTYLPNWSNHVMNLEKIEEETASTEFKVGDKVKVLDSQNGAEGEATITALLEDGKVRLEGKSGSGVYSYCWSNRVSNIEKIEEEDLDPEEADELLGYRYWYLEGTTFNKFVVLEASPEGYFEDSRGKRYTHQAVSGHVKPIDREDAYVKFDDAERKGALLSYYPTVDIFQISY